MNFSGGVFVIFLAVFMLITTIFIVLEWKTGFQVLLGNAPIWAWSACTCASILVFFSVWFLVFLIRRKFINEHYRLMKATFALYGAWMPLTWLLWTCVEFGTLQMLVVWGLNPTTQFWLQNTLWAIFAMSFLWLLQDIFRRRLLISIERDLLWRRLAFLFWREKLMKEMLECAMEAKPAPLSGEEQISVTLQSMQDMFRSVSEAFQSSEASLKDLYHDARWSSLFSSLLSFFLFFS